MHNSYRDEREYSEVVELDMRTILTGHASGKTADGYKFSVVRTVDQRWSAFYDGDLVGDHATWQEAAEDLELALASDGYRMRRIG